MRELQQHCRDIEALPDTGVPGKLRQDLADELAQVSQHMGQEDFHRHVADLNSMLTSIKARTRDAASSMALEQKERLRTVEQELQNLPGWAELSREEGSSVLSQVENLALEAPKDLSGLKILLSHDYVIHSQVQDIRKRIEKVAAQRVLERENERQERARSEGIWTQKVKIPSRIQSIDALNSLLKSLESLRAEILKHDKVDVALVQDAAQPDGEEK